MAKSGKQADDGHARICAGARAATQRERTTGPYPPDAHTGTKHLPTQPTGRPRADLGLHTLPRDFPTAGRLLAERTLGYAMDGLDPA
jgi:hypothetical protein